MEAFGKFCFGVLAIVVAALIGGFVFMKLWAWFVVYAFGVQELNLIQSIGIVFFVSYLKKKKKDDDGEEIDWEKFVKEFFTGIFWDAIILGLGWLITLLQ